MDRIAIFAALRWECQPPLRFLRHVSKRRLGTLTLWQGQARRAEIWLIKTGMGMERADHAARLALDAGRFDLLMSTGCAGALAPQLTAGELVIASELIDRTTGHRYPTDAGTRAAAEAAARRAAVPVVSQPSLCSAQMLASVADRRALLAQTGAVAVDMEGAAIAAYAAAVSIPFASVRAILDTADVDLDTTTPFIDPQTGAVKPLALAATLVRHPGLVPRLVSMQSMMSAAQRSLNQFFAAWLNP
ncbi:MAG TPA: hypothetical protein VMW17_15640 [Candidatus Binatia bacterium]|nr:hypothetical protein [Candidatus Binatia bacterium]